MTTPLVAGEPIAPRPGRAAGAAPVEPTPPTGPKRRPPRRRSPFAWIGRLAGALLGLVALVVIVGGVAAWGAWRHFSADLPSVDGLRGYQPRVMSRVYAGDARLIAELATERRIFVPFSAIPDVVKKAFVSAEDQNFWVHRGVDPLAIIRAGITNLSQYGQGRRPIGASTITQQVAKNMLLDSELTLSRKVKEAILALRIEDTLSKDRILELYLNEIYLGLQSYGVAAAAQAYFNKPLDDLTAGEAAFLAALPKAPNNYNPFRFPDAARARRDWVLDRMAEDHVITAEEARTAKATPVVPARFHRPAPIEGSDWFAEEVRRRLIERFGADATTQGGLVVRTSLDPKLQNAADRALRDGLVNYDRKFGGWRGPAGHLDGAPATLRTDWQARLEKATRPAGVPPEWRVAVVIESTDSEARVGWVEPGGAARSGAVLLSDIGWARPVHDGHVGPAPRRIGDVMQPGDIVLIEPPTSTDTAQPTPVQPSTAAARARAPVARADRVTLRQIPAVQGALVSLEPATGRVLAMVGGWSFESSQFNRATQANRQPGSSFKPMVYLTALEQGVSPSQRFMDAPIVIDQGAAGQWRPNNYEMSFSGPTPLRIALEKSLNLVTLRVAERVGMDAVAQTAIAFHVVDAMPRVLPAALGAVDTTVLRQAGAYASLAMGGREVIPRLIDSVQDRDGHVVFRAPGLSCEGCDAAAGLPPGISDGRKQIADPESVFQLVTMMQGVVQRGTGYEAGKGLNRAIAGKTGTSQDFNDAWFVGFTPDLATAVWIGYDNPASLGNNETGGAVAAPIWHNFMAVALKDRPNLTFPVPPGVTLAKWDSGSGQVTDAFKPGQTPGASGPVGGATASADNGDAGSAGSGAPAAAAGGVDSGMGGLY
jgi:penicillin-binding protein 1A